MATRKKPAASRTVEPARAGFPIVGICASAGGLEAFKQFFGPLPADSGMGFVLIPHLDPTHASLMVELVGKHTTMPVVEATDGQPVEVDRVYVIPPSYNMAIKGGLLRLSEPPERRGLYTSIDFFLRSLADDQGEQAIGIVLSGTGTHGTLGLKAIKANGGLVLVQAPDTAQHDQMPRSAVNAGIADYVLAPEQMAEALLAYRRQPYLDSERRHAEDEPPVEELKPILELLRARTKYDFRCYRKKMLVRRIERRMGLKHLASMTAYLAYLREHGEEVKQLAKDLFISVTCFFRDPDSYEVLANQVVPELVQRTLADGPLRAWIPGCATGEEAYSVAILLMEQLAKVQLTCHLQVFASDVDEDALAVGRLGTYPETIAADLTAERLNRFFAPAGDHEYRVSKTLREAVVFGTQNLITDAPFSKLDLISCRNVLIYLEPEQQRKIVALLHFALNDGGYLILGSSETIGRHTDLFEPISKKWRIYRRLTPINSEYLSFPVTSQRASDGRKPPGVPALNLAELTQLQLLEELDSTALLVNPKFEIVYYHGKPDLYLNLQPGAPTQELLRLARPGLLAKLRAALHKAVHKQQRVIVPHIRVKHDGSISWVKLTVKPVPTDSPANQFLLVVLEKMRDALPRNLDGREEAEEQLEVQLEQQLQAARYELQNSITELETANEELKASNEETMSMNEELQSVNEELETSKEELQSLNEELNTVNSQLQEKIEELESTNNDLANLFTSTDVATIFLDTDFRLKRFTPATRRLLSLLPGDVGRPIQDFARRFTDDELLHDLEAVLRDLIPREKEVRADDGHLCLRRIVPYRMHENRIGGLVVTFVDVTQLKQAGERQRLLATVLLDSNDAVTVEDFSGRFTAWNRGAEHMYGYTEAEALTLDAAQLVPPPLRAEAAGVLARLQRGEAVHAWETRRLCKGGSILDVWLTLTTLYDESGAPFAVATTGRDVTLRNQEAQALRQSEALVRQQLAEAALEKRRIGQDLHDSVGQELTGIGLMADSLADRFDQDVPEAATLRKIVGTTRRALSQVRALSRGLIPVEVDAEGLMAALAELAERTSGMPDHSTTFTCVEPVLVENTAAATHLYHIAQEAVTNALKHSQARHIDIALQLEGGQLTLSIQDDGSSPPGQWNEARGMGLKIMRYRAGLINATLRIGPAKGGGTEVSCVLSQGEARADTEAPSDA